MAIGELTRGAERSCVVAMKRDATSDETQAVEGERKSQGQRPEERHQARRRVFSLPAALAEERPRFARAAHRVFSVHTKHALAFASNAEHKRSSQAYAWGSRVVIIVALRRLRAEHDPIGYHLP